MKVLVTGASGFIGSRLVGQLSRRHQVFALVRVPPTAALSKRVSLITSNLAGPIDLSALPSQIDLIIHLAQANAPFPEGARDVFAVNSIATQQLLEYGRRAGARRFILASSGYVYGRRLGPCKESDPVAPADFYAATKYASELLVQAYASYMHPCVLRLFWPYGPGQQDRLIPRLADRIRQERPIRLHPDDHPYLTPLYIDDLLTAFERVLHRSYSGVLNLAGGTVVSMRQLIAELGEVLDASPVLEETSDTSGDWAGDNTCMKQVLGSWPMVELREGLSRTFQPQKGIPCHVGR